MEAGLIKRHPDNPILTAEDWPYPVNAVFNAGATRLRNGTTLLLCRVEDYRGHSHFCAARSKDGISNWVIDRKPTLAADIDDHPEELWGIEDARIVWLDEMRKYSLAYTAYSRGGPCVALALTEDFKTFERYGVCMPPEDKDAALLPHRVGENWAMIHRPAAQFGGAHIWISYSPDLRHWGSHKILMMARRGAWWDANKIGLSAPLIETPDGWLMLYHGVRTTASGSLYRWGLALFDLETPEKCLLRGDQWVFGPIAEYERVGDVGGAVFPCGYTVRDDGDTVYIYYGGADSCMALAVAKISEMLEWLEENGCPWEAPPHW